VLYKAESRTRFLHLCPFIGEIFVDTYCDLIGTKSDVERMLVYVWSKVGLSNEFTYLGIEVERRGQWKQHYGERRPKFTRQLIRA